MTYTPTPGQIIDVGVRTLPLVLTGAQNVTLRRGTVPGIVLNNCVGTKVVDVDIPAMPDKVGVMVRGGSADLFNITVKGGLNSVVFSGCDAGSLLHSELSGYTGDGVHVFGSRNIDIIRNRIIDGMSDGLHHPDAIQMHNLIDLGRWVCDVRILGNFIRHMGQGVQNTDDGDLAWMRRIYVEGNDVSVGAWRALSLHHLLDSRCAGNRVSFLPGAVSGTRLTPVTGTKVEVGPTVAYEDNTLGDGVELLKAVA